MLIIDSHAHIYSEDQFRYPPALGAKRPPATRGSLMELNELAREYDIAGVCAIQPFSFYRWDNSYLCNFASAHRSRIAGICLLDPDDPESTLILERHVAQFGICGLRSYPAACGRLDDPGVHALWQTACNLGLVVNASVGAEKIDELARMLARFAGLAVVVDHCLLTQPTSDSSSILKDFLKLAQFPNAYAKLSFLPLASEEEYPFRDMHEPCKEIIAAFGPERCVWGNAFPTDLWSPRSTYAQNLRLFISELGLGTAAKASILGRTANRLWFRGRLVSCNGAHGRGEAR